MNVEAGLAGTQPGRAARSRHRCAPRPAATQTNRTISSRRPGLRPCRNGITLSNEEVQGERARSRRYGGKPTSCWISSTATERGDLRAACTAGWHPTPNRGRCSCTCLCADQHDHSLFGNPARDLRKGKAGLRELPHKPIAKHGRSVHAPWTRAERVHRGPREWPAGATPGRCSSSATSRRKRGAC